MDPFASPHNLDRELYSLLAEASSNLCDWFSDSGSQGPIPDSFYLPEAYPAKEGVSNKVLLINGRSIATASQADSGKTSHAERRPAAGPFTEC